MDQPSVRDLSIKNFNPGVEPPGYCHMPLVMRRAHFHLMRRYGFQDGDWLLLRKRLFLLGGNGDVGLAKLVGEVDGDVAHHDHSQMRFALD